MMEYKTNDRIGHGERRINDSQDTQDGKIDNFSFKIKMYRKKTFWKEVYLKLYIMDNKGQNLKRAQFLFPFDRVYP